MFRYVRQGSVVLMLRCIMQVSVVLMIPLSQAHRQAHCKLQGLQNRACLEIGEESEINVSAAFRSETGGYNEAAAESFARAAQIAFCAPTAIESWNCGESCEQLGFVRTPVYVIEEKPLAQVQGFIALLRDKAQRPPAQCIASFRGSSNAANWKADLLGVLAPWQGEGGGRQCPKCKFHFGIMRAYEELRADFLIGVHHLGCKQIHITGHSLGAAVATLASFDLRVTRPDGIVVSPAWLFGAPPVGNKAFRELYTMTILDGEQPGSYRIINKYDPVPRLGDFVGKYTHVGPEVVYHEGKFTYCDEPDDNNCRLKVGKIALLRNLKADNHCLYLGLPFQAKDLPEKCKAPANVTDVIKVYSPHANPFEEEEEPSFGTDGEERL